MLNNLLQKIKKYHFICFTDLELTPNTLVISTDTITISTDYILIRERVMISELIDSKYFTVSYREYHKIIISLK